MKYLILIVATAISSVAVAQAFKKEVTICSGYNIQWHVPEKVYSISKNYKRIRTICKNIKNYEYIF